MIRKLQRLKSKRGFTIIELIVVIAIIGIMTASIVASANTRSSKIKEANYTAHDFYLALQSEFTRMQMLDCPLTMTLADKYSTDSGLSEIQSDWQRYGGVKYYPAVGGNYPFASADMPLDTAGQLSDVPKEMSIFIEAYVIAGNLKHVDFADTASSLYAMTGSHTTELGAVLMQEMNGRMEYKDGYYYAKVSYAPPSGVSLSVYDYKTIPIKVEWAAYCTDEITSDTNTQTFGANNNMLASNKVCGVCAEGGSTVGTAGSVLQ